MVRPTRRPTGDTRVQLHGTANTGSFYITNSTLESPATERSARARSPHPMSSSAPTPRGRCVTTFAPEGGNCLLRSSTFFAPGAPIQVFGGRPGRPLGDPQRHRRPIAAEHGDHLSVLADTARFVTGIAIYDKMRFASQK